MNENFESCDERDAARSLVQWKSAVRNQAIASAKDSTAMPAKPHLRIFSQYDQAAAITTRFRPIAVVNPEDFCSDQEAA